MQKECNGKRDFKALERRRLKAAALFGAEKSQAEVAKALGVTAQSSHRWYRAWQRDGEVGLKAAGRAGRNPKLTAEQLARVEQELLRGPTAQGYATEVWTLPRIAQVIRKLTGVQYHPGHVWRLLRALEWSVQRPEHRAKERNDEAIERWVKRRWPQRKRGR
jgi:transposase